MAIRHAEVKSVTDWDAHRWTVMHLLPAVEKSMVAIEQLLGDRAQGLVMELEDIKSSVWQKAERVRETSVRHTQEPH